MADDTPRTTPPYFQSFTDIQVSASREVVADLLAEFGGVATPEAVRRIGETLQFGDGEVLWLLGEQTDAR